MVGSRQWVRVRLWQMTSLKWQNSDISSALQPSPPVTTMWSCVCALIKEAIFRLLRGPLVKQKPATFTLDWERLAVLWWGDLTSSAQTCHPPPLWLWLMSLTSEAAPPLIQQEVSAAQCWPCPGLSSTGAQTPDWKSVRPVCTHHYTSL